MDRAVTVMTFQLRGLRAATDMSDISSRAQSSNGPSAGMNSTEVPSKSASTEHSSTSSSRSAQRLGTMLPIGSLWVRDHDDEKPSAPASKPARSSAFMASSSSPVLARRTLSSPITTRRRAEWPTLNPALTATFPSMASKYSAVVRQLQGTPCCSASRGMPSTRASIRIR